MSPKRKSDRLGVCPWCEGVLALEAKPDATGLRKEYHVYCDTCELRGTLRFPEVLP